MYRYKMKEGQRNRDKDTSGSERMFMGLLVR